MKVLAFNSSPRMGKGNTGLILNPFVEGMREAGAEVELFYNRKLNINPCRGCGICGLKTPGKCFRKDDMQMLYPKLREADIWVFATPVHWYGVPGPMKNLIDRMVPLLLPFYELHDGHCWQSPRQGTKSGKAVLVSSCGYWEMDSFDQLLAHMRAFCWQASREFAGALLRPHADALMPVMEMGQPVSDIFEAAKHAGHQLVKDGRMSTETLVTISREFMPLEKYIDFCNQWFREALDVLEKK